MKFISKCLYLFQIYKITSTGADITTKSEEAPGKCPAILFCYLFVMRPYFTHQPLLINYHHLRT
jgi:hypothetical protein